MKAYETHNKNTRCIFKGLIDIGLQILHISLNEGNSHGFFLPGVS